MLKKCVVSTSIAIIIMSVYYYYNNIKYNEYRENLKKYIKCKSMVEPFP